MLFSSLTFLYWFLPLTLAVYFLVPQPGGRARWRNLVLLVASLVFYAWGEPKFVLVMAAEVIALWALGLMIERSKRAGSAPSPSSRAERSGDAGSAHIPPAGMADPATARRMTGPASPRFWLVVSIVVGLAGLAYFKYADFFIAGFDAAFGASIPLLRIALPIGISFYTFQMLSYSIDLYRGKAECQRNLLDFATYVTMFPQLIAGPIVRYTDVAQRLAARPHTLDRFGRGAARFAVGLGKKVLVANVLAQLVDVLKASPDQSALAAWLYVLAFGLQIYFDFSGYSDMAIGLGLILGFDFPENFNYPYIARSITDFWRRWHMTLSGWFRDYVYIPLGGNRVTIPRHLLNIAVVWALTGFWHGAAWNFLAWGCYFAVILMAEKYLGGGVLQRLPGPLGHLYALLAVGFGWVLFDGASAAGIAATLGQLFGTSGAAGPQSLYYLRSYLVPLAIGIIGATPLPRQALRRLAQRPAATILQPAAVALVLVAVTAFLVDGSFNPFIYFRF